MGNLSNPGINKETDRTRHIVSTRNTLRESVKEVFQKDGSLAKVLEHYETRKSQQQMADSVAITATQGGTLLAEAGTGTGKTLAYLVPLILNKQRVIISTGTKNLQEQIFFKDLPVLRKIFSVPFTATMMKGRSNYLCLHRFNQVSEADQVRVALPFSKSKKLNDSEQQIFLPLIQEWARHTNTGDRSELHDLPEELPLWHDIAATADTCLGSECEEYNECFVTRMRQKATEADVVIVNHHLLCADAAVRESAFGEVIPACTTLVVDEAHQLENVATQHFGISLNSHGINELVRDVERLLTNQPLALQPDGRNINEEIRQAFIKVTNQTKQFFAGLELAATSSVRSDNIRRTSDLIERKLRYTEESFSEHLENSNILTGALDALHAILAEALTSTETLETKLKNELSNLTKRTSAISKKLRFLSRATDIDYVYYLSTRSHGVTLCASPVDVSKIINESLLDRMQTTILTSATLTIEGSFNYVRKRLGAQEAHEIRVSSEFDYATQTILYLPQHMPPPRSSSFAESAAQEIVELLEQSKGRAFVLFTSHAVLREVHPIIEAAVTFPVLVQGRAPRSAMLSEFRETPHAVLMATSSFWQGVDVVGESLSCVIIDKLPFASPSDPITAARIEAIAAEGGDPFSDYQVPVAVLALQQGLGRLIRHRNDRGVLAVLDPRIQTMGYGKRFLDSLPPAPRTNDLRVVKDFLEANSQN